MESKTKYIYAFILAIPYLIKKYFIMIFPISLGIFIACFPFFLNLTNFIFPCSLIGLFLAFIPLWYIIIKLGYEDFIGKGDNQMKKNTLKTIKIQEEKIKDLIQQNKRLKERNNELELVLKNIASNLYFLNDWLKNNLWDNILSKKSIILRAKNISKLYFDYGKTIIDILIDLIIKKCFKYCDNPKSGYTRNELEQIQITLKQEATKKLKESRKDYEYLGKRMMVKNDKNEKNI